jgi:hypothetical protein
MTLWIYIKELFKNFFAKFAAISTISGLILFYTNIDTKNIIVNFIINNLIIVSLIFLFIATYQVWKNIKSEKQELEEKFKNPIQYKIEAHLQEVYFDFEHIENNFINECNNLKEIIDDTNKEIEKLSTLLQHNKPIVKMFEGISGASALMHNYPSSAEQYLASLKDYKQELENFPNTKDEYIQKWQTFIDNDVNNLYFIGFDITNIGIKANEDIEINIMFNNDNKHIDTPIFLEKYPSIILPKEPEKPKSSFDNILNPIFNTVDLNIPNIEHPNAFRKFEKIEDDCFSITMRDIKVGEKIQYI